MATKTYVDGGKQAITFNNDTQPVAVYVDGDLQENVSFVPDSVQGTGSVEYLSEYKKNHITMDVQGATSQPIVEVVQSLTSYTATEEDYTESSYARILRSADLISLPTGATSVDVSLTNISSLANVPSNITFLLMNQARTVVNVLYMDGASYSATVTEPFYIAIADEEDGNLNQNDYDTFIQHVGLKMVYNGENVQPSPTTPKPIQNANDNGMSVILRGENLFNAQGEVAFGAGYSRFEYGNNYVTNRTVTPSAADHVVFSKTYPAGTYTISAKGEYAGDGFTYRFLCTAKSNGGTYNSYYKSYYFDFLNTTSPQTSFTFTTTEDFQIGFAMSGTPTYLRGTIYDIMLTPTSQAVKYKPYVEETIEIPTSIDVNGTNVPLLFSEYDKLTVDRVKNEVIYHNGGYSKTLNGNEAMGSSTTLFKVWVTIPFKLTGDGFCNQFLSPTDFIFANNLSFGDSGMAFPMSRFSSTNALATFLAEQYNNGTPVVILAQKETPTPYNITNTDLGQALLNLATQNQTNYFEVQGNSNAPQTPINFTFAKWGGKK